MFRDIVRFKQKISQEECIEVLTNEVRGVLCVNGDDGYPYGSPINHWYDPESGCIYFHGGLRGHKIDSMKRDPKVSFCVYDQGYRKEGDWALNIKCVIVFGRVEFLTDQDEMDKCCLALCHKFTDDEDYIKDEFRRSMAHTLCFKLIPEHMTGKLVNES